ncbi:protein FAM13A-like isoform X2 [Mya arenaria]|uniref:protein FAM13A-like isoform X2 n=1 Tax=Mya arenaria TaxID=6604 RepID=UPI0022E3478C|nr:protein FAM13A-like isoform X2 [Mya arenaria]
MVHPSSLNEYMDKGRKINSPGMKKRLLQQGARTFGVPLSELVDRAPLGYRVPFIVKKICSFIEHHGLEYEGIFRVNGSQRVVEKLRASFDLQGDANLEEDNDMMAVAGLLKLFLRELPETAVPEKMTRRFVMVHEEHQRDARECVNHLKMLLKVLPEEHYDLLKHMIRFLAIVACNEAVNRMSPMALAIVFGPNLFRCGKGFLALKDQGTTNQIVYRFIVDYNTLFKDSSEDTPAVYWERKKHNLVPPRPPPPKIAYPEPEAVSPKPTPLPRKSKLKTQEGSQVPEIEEPDRSESSVSSKGRNSHSYNSPSFSDDEMTGRLSPFHLDSESGYSLIESPVPSARTSEFVDKAIKATVIGHLFGDECSLLNASIDTTIREEDSEHATEADVEKKTTNNNSNATHEAGPGVKSRVQAFEAQDIENFEPASNKPVKQKPMSKAFEMFEKKGVIITQLPASGLSGVGEEKDDSDEEFAAIHRNTDPLHLFKRPTGPQNRRSPSRQLRRNSTGDSDEEVMDQQEQVPVIMNGHLPQTSPIDVPKLRSGDNTHGDTHTRIAFLDIRQDNTNNRGLSVSPDKSPTVSAKPFVPPLDFSTLHENVGSQDPILAQKAQAVSYQRATLAAPEMQQNDDEDYENDVPSPRLNKVKRKAGTSVDDEDLPFSQAEQDQYKSHSHGSTDDELTTKMKGQMRKIQGLKKKIRQFEDVFERENGFRPSHAEKASRVEVKKLLTDLSRARKEAKRLKEEAEMGSRSRHGSGTSSAGERIDPPDLPPSMGSTLDIILKRLHEKRKDMHRPEDIELMNHDQVQDEKLSVQKALLHFEGIHGRPKSRDEKDLMRPLYDRYRTIKRLLSRQPPSPRSNLELQTVPEDKPMDIQSKYNDGVPGEKVSIHVPTAIMENDEEDDNVANMGTADFAFTRDFSILQSRPVAVENQGPHSPKARRKLELPENGVGGGGNRGHVTDSNLHELSVPELKDELMKSRGSKKRLRKTLRDFEEGFAQQAGRKVGREDRQPMQTEYNEYKQLKARLRLLEALLSKHQLTDLV